MTNITSVTDRIEVTKLLSDAMEDEIRGEIRKGLTAEQKSLPSKYFYDARGSELFREICRLPEYYQTRTELAILKGCAGSIIQNYREADIIELGSGEDLKIRTLLDAAFDSPGADICYIPVDVSEAALLESAKELCRTYPELRVAGIVADFTKHLELLPRRRKRLFLFFGSTIGNFAEERRIEFLGRMARQMEAEDRFILGIDMIKPVEILEGAYNDSRGVTAKFNKNILNVMNRRLNADFDTGSFEHLAFYNADEERVEMHLRARCSLLVEIGDLGLWVNLHEGETIRTEVCKKFSTSSAAAMAEDAGMRIEGWHSDPEGWFSLLELSAVKRV
ncbi:MAG: L-histidine N(alpha)-methyltransferase [Candidatus Sulfobium sp.]|jgi:L-histidine N-alpha-methyltransferase